MTSRIQKKRRVAFQKQGKRCYYCGCLMWHSPITEFASKRKLPVSEAEKLRLTAEHLKARSAGGTNASHNIVAACLFCNQERHRMASPLEPNDYKLHVRRELAAGRWHGHQSA